MAALGLEPVPKLAFEPYPALVAFAQFLALSAVEVEDAVERELADNPALERIEEPSHSPGAHGIESLECVPSASDPRERLLAEFAILLDPVPHRFCNKRLPLRFSPLRCGDMRSGALKPVPNPVPSSQSVAH
jgi:hypothetical protein